MARFIIAVKMDGVTGWHAVASFHTIECAERRLATLRAGALYGARYVIVTREMLPYWPIRSAA